MRTFQEIASSNPRLAIRIAWLIIARRMRPPAGEPKILVGTHHKVLTVYMANVFRVFASASRRTSSRGTKDRVDYTAHILLDSHSQFAFSKLSCPYVGIHVRRDSRDVIVSCAKYHLNSHEEWLHTPRTDLSGRTYQEHLRSVPTLEEQLLFELDHSGGRVVRRMLEWHYHRPGISEWKYEDLLNPDSLKQVEEKISQWPLLQNEAKVLAGLLWYYSIWGKGSAGSKHIRNPKPAQWKQAFSERVQTRFLQLFPTAAEDLGYEPFSAWPSAPQ